MEGELTTKGRFAEIRWPILQTRGNSKLCNKGLLYLEDSLSQRTPQSCLRKGSKFAFLNAVTLRDKSGVTSRLFIAQSENNKTTSAILFLSLLFRKLCLR